METTYLYVDFELKEIIRKKYHINISEVDIVGNLIRCN